MKLRPSVENDLRRLDRMLRRKLILGCRDVFDDWTIGKRLGTPLHGLRSHRVNEYRIIYKIHASSEIDIIATGHRNEIYERMEERKKSKR
ncbi:type II toxin-antitoxin system RelE/ParE family toxin [Candidatus Peregrinibacteria bacterium]|nr:type II toxin-antitoxin system RelE/ParE family toxin [Candidatus Peregrinibacteria bacterium]MBI3816273.1 type II toxin-antitoxin system RelE/ParE family toxin [Candidatus Peregrinibacteria bacterium]